MTSCLLKGLQKFQNYKSSHCLPHPLGFILQLLFLSGTEHWLEWGIVIIIFGPILNTVGNQNLNSSSKCPQM